MILLMKVRKLKKCSQ